MEHFPVTNKTESTPNAIRPLDHSFLSMLTRCLPAANYEFSVAEFAEDVDEPLDKILFAFENLLTLGVIECTRDDDQIKILTKDTDKCSVYNYFHTFPIVPDPMKSA